MNMAYWYQYWDEWVAIFLRLGWPISRAALLREDRGAGDAGSFELWWGQWSAEHGFENGTPRLWREEEDS
jgi:hypothetical protein